MNAPTLITALILAAVVGLIARYLWKKRKSGGCACGGDCGACGGCHGARH